MNAAMPLQYPASEVAQSPAVPARKHSKLGVASFLIALGFPLLLLVLFAIPAVGYGRIYNQTDDEIFLIVIMFGGLGGPITHFVGLVIGIAGAFQKERKRIFAVLGIALNGILLFLIAIAWIVFFGWLMKALAWH